MKLADVLSTEANVEPTISVKRQMIKSTLPFPYVNLEEVAALAKAMSDKGGVPLTRWQLADAMNTTETSHFSLKIGAAKLFNVIDLPTDGSSKLSLTEIGHGLASDDEEKTRAARRDAFLSVELYRKLYEHFRGKTLPPKRGIENAMINLGVSQKQSGRARQTFDRSAQFAGFLSAGRDRLVEPVIVPALSNFTPKNEQALNQKMPENSSEIVGMSFGDPLAEPLIHGLMKRMPPIGANWPLRDRVKWLKTFVSNLDAVYSDADRPNDEIEVKILSTSDLI